MLNLEAQLNVTSPQYIRNARYKLAGTISFPVVLVLTSQMSGHDLINHGLGILLILNGALEPETKLRFHSSPALHTPCLSISSQSVHLHQTCPSCAHPSSPYLHHSCYTPWISTKWIIWTTCDWQIIKPLKLM